MSTDLPPKSWFRYNVSIGPQKGGKMAKRRHTPEQVINKVGEAEVATAEGSTVAEVARRIGVTEQTFYRPPMPEALLSADHVPVLVYHNGWYKHRGQVRRAFHLIQYPPDSIQHRKEPRNRNSTTTIY